MINLPDAAWCKSRRSGPRDNCVEVAATLWRKSRRSYNGGANCVEVAPAAWRKSRRSDNGGQNCVEIADAGRTVAVRDSKDPDGGRLAFSRSRWRAFAERVKAGDFDLS